MAYVLVYRSNGDEYRETGLATLDEVNAAIEHLYEDDGLPGAPIVAILRIEEGHDGPRTWRIEYPPAPPAGTRMLNGVNVPFVVRENRRVEHEGKDWPWEIALRKFGPFTEVVEAEVQAAARRLRESDWSATLVSRGLQHDIRIVLRHVLDGGQL